MREDPGVRVVGFLDDNPDVRRRRVHGIVVLGGLDEVEAALESARPGRGADHDPECGRRAARPGHRRVRGRRSRVPAGPPAHGDDRADARGGGRRVRRGSPAGSRLGQKRRPPSAPRRVLRVLRVLRLAGLAARDAVDLHGRARADADLARDRAHRSSGAARRVPYHFTSLYPYFTAPAWWLHATQEAFDTIKYLGVLAMTGAIFPAYGIARTVLSKPWAVAAAVGAVAAPALSYSPILVEEPLAYLAATVALWLILRATLGRARVDRARVRRGPRRHRGPLAARRARRRARRSRSAVVGWRTRTDASLASVVEQVGLDRRDRALRRRPDRDQRHRQPTLAGVGDHRRASTRTGCGRSGPGLRAGWQSGSACCR